ncbi:hypothetical protein FNV43_RR20838 [Rhamnella rubrinervis]|uniref:Uncharacterized protein n=1 Tax=Rhamnella rubrinervis TaxID=2594499 RepID=A0A8K0E799_9ROSA|nr:hypothetical protein FNV43_RR20838 [Rhamnella rubrinervis]
MCGSKTSALDGRIQEPKPPRISRVLWWVKNLDKRIRWHCGSVIQSRGRWGDVADSFRDLAPLVIEFAFWLCVFVVDLNRFWEIINKSLPNNASIL